MKKIITLSVVLLLAASCSRQPSSSQTNNQNQPTPTPSQSQVYENNNLKATVLPGWTVQEVSGNPGAVNITRDSYILYINTQATQASGVQGGRFAEIAMGAPSADAVVTEQPSSPCGTSEKTAVTGTLSRTDLYVSGQDKKSYCNVPTNGKTVWYFSYVVGPNGGYFNYYNQNSTSPAGYVITMGYNSKDVNQLPERGSSELTTALSEMTDMVKTLEIKQK